MRGQYMGRRIVAGMWYVVGWWWEGVERSAGAAGGTQRRAQTGAQTTTMSVMNEYKQVCMQ